MRNLILLIAAVVFVLVGLHIYLEYDKKRLNEFMANLPQLPSEVPHTLSSTASTVKTSVDEAKQTEQAEAGINMKQVSTDAEDASELILSTETSDQESEIAGWDTMAEFEENPLSPEMQVLFSTFYSREKQLQAVAAELEPLIDESISIGNRHPEISLALSLAPDEAAQQALNEERIALRARGKEISPMIFDLQEEEELLTKEQESLLTENGFTSRGHFFETHRENYKAWKAAQ